MVGQFRASGGDWQDQSPREFTRRADEALAEGDTDRCIALIEKLYALLDEQYRQ